MRLQKDFDHTEHYVFKHELRTIEVNVENLDIIHHHYLKNEIV